MKRSPEIEALLEQCELKKTPFRLELVGFFFEVKAPVSAGKVFEALLKNKRLKNSKFDRATLFRNLKIMVEKNVLNTTDFGTGAAYYCLNSDHHHHHVFCVNCEQTKSLPVCAVAPMVDQAQRLGFKVLTHRLELLGLCPDCR